MSDHPTARLPVQQGYRPGRRRRRWPVVLVVVLLIVLGLLVVADRAAAAYADNRAATEMQAQGFSTSRGRPPGLGCAARTSPASSVATVLSLYAARSADGSRGLLPHVNCS